MREQFRINFDQDQLGWLIAMKICGLALALEHQIGARLDALTRRSVRVLIR